MAKLLIKRNSEWANRMRPIQLFINGQEFMEIKHGQLVSVDIPEGNYWLNAKMGWGLSRPLKLQVEKDDTKRIEIKGFLLSEYFLPASLVLLIIYIGIFLVFNENNLPLAFVIMLFFGYWLYFSTIGRKDYIRLIER